MAGALLCSPRSPNPQAIYRLIDGFLSSINMHGLSHEYLLQAILPMIQSSDSFSGVSIFLLQKKVSVKRGYFQLPFLFGPGSILHTLM